MPTPVSPAQLIEQARDLLASPRLPELELAALLFTEHDEVAAYLRDHLRALPPGAASRRLLRALPLREHLLHGPPEDLYAWTRSASEEELTLLLLATQRLVHAPLLDRAQAALQGRLQGLLQRDAEDLLVGLCEEILAEPPVARAVAQANLDDFEADSVELHAFRLTSDRAATLHATLTLSNDPRGASFYVGDNLQVDLHATAVWADHGAWEIQDFRVTEVELAR